ncbi:uncharacterized protein [Nicotiana tomentosiformis]|uniref:uncharacterized protein n=1 Tax=Nicotiana tomentosiformis TaxID=4098 RepID=UPI00388CB191
MVKTLIWNIRSVKTQQAFQRVITMQKEHGFFIVALMEPFQTQGLIQTYRRRLGMEFAISNVNGKIWLFLDASVEWELLIDTDQQLIIKVYHQELKLWDNLYYLDTDMELPWVVGEDFSVILAEEEKIGGLPVYPPEIEDFAFCVNSCGLFDTSYKGSAIFPNIEVEHLIRTGSDHAPLLMHCREDAMQFKLKRVKIALSRWSNLTFGDISKQLAIREDIVKIKEILFEEDPIMENRIMLQQAELKRYLSIEEQY